MHILYKINPILRKRLTDNVDTQYEEMFKENNHAFDQANRAPKQHVPHNKRTTP